MSAGSIIGAGAGAFLALVATFVYPPLGAYLWTSIFVGAAFGATLGLYIDPIRPDVPSPGQAQAFEAYPTIREGEVIPDTIGTAQSSGFIIYYWNNRSVAITQEVGGGKGSGSETVTTGYQYYMTWMQMFTIGPMDMLFSIWKDDTPVWGGALSRPVSGYSVIYLQGMGWAEIYWGNSDQYVNPYYSAAVGATQASRYKNIAYIFFSDCATYANANRLPNMKFVFGKFPNYGTGYERINVFTYNPALAVYYILTSVANLPANLVNWDSFVEAAATLYNENIGISVYMDQQSAAKVYIETICKHVNATIQPDADGKLKFILLRKSIPVESVPAIYEVDMVEKPRLDLKTWLEVSNHVKIQHMKLVGQAGPEMPTHTVAITAFDWMRQSGATYVIGGTGATGTGEVTPFNEPALYDPVCLYEISKYTTGWVISELKRVASSGTGIGSVKCTSSMFGANRYFLDIYEPLSSDITGISIRRSIYGGGETIARIYEVGTNYDMYDVPFGCHEALDKSGYGIIIGPGGSDWEYEFSIETNNFGASWSSVPQIIDWVADGWTQSSPVCIDPVTGWAWHAVCDMNGTLDTDGYHTKVYRKAGFGEPWVLVTTFEPPPGLGGSWWWQYGLEIKAYNSHIYIAGTGWDPPANQQIRIYRSLDNGANWTTIDNMVLTGSQEYMYCAFHFYQDVNGNDVLCFVTGIMLGGGSPYTAGTAFRIYRSVDSAATFTITLHINIVDDDHVYDFWGAYQLWLSYQWPYYRLDGDKEFLVFTMNGMHEKWFWDTNENDLWPNVEKVYPTGIDPLIYQNYNKSAFLFSEDGGVTWKMMVLPQDENYLYIASGDCARNDSA